MYNVLCKCIHSIRNHSDLMNKSKHLIYWVTVMNSRVMRVLSLKRIRKPINLGWWMWESVAKLYLVSGFSVMMMPKITDRINSAIRFLTIIHLCYNPYVVIQVMWWKSHLSCVSCVKARAIGCFVSLVWYWLKLAILDLLDWHHAFLTP